MRKPTSLVKVLMTVYGVAGVATGLLFARIQYHKGKLDAYNDIQGELNKLTKTTEEMIKKESE